MITKTDTNPFFVKMKTGAEAKAADPGMILKSFAGKIDGDHEAQVAAIDAADATFATDNFLVRELIGKWAAAKLRDDATNAKIGMIDLAVSKPTMRFCAIRVSCRALT